MLRKCASSSPHAEIASLVPKGKLMAENEWRGIGVQQSRGWVHYAIHRPEPHIMLFRRPKGYGTVAAGQPGMPMGDAIPAQ